MTVTSQAVALISPLLLSTALFLHGCAVTPTQPGEPLSSAESAIREESRWFSASNMQACLLMGDLCLLLRDKSPACAFSAIGPCGTEVVLIQALKADRQNYASREQSIQNLIAEVNKDNQHAATLLANTKEVIAQDLRKIEAIYRAYKAKRLTWAQAQQELQLVHDNIAALENALVGMKTKEQYWRDSIAADLSPALDQEIRQLQANVAALEHDLHGSVFFALRILVPLPETQTTNASVPSSQLSPDPPPAPRIPQFPWPPPRASSTIVIPSHLLQAKGGATTLGDVDTQIRTALEENGYFDSSYYVIPDGFALVTRIEQINDDGTPTAGDQRWSIEVPRFAKLSFTDYLRALFLAPARYYRVIVFLIAPHAFVPAGEHVTAEDALHWAVEGANQLPPSTAEQYFSRQSYDCTAIIYEFSRRTESDQPTILAPGRIQGRIHLEKAGIWGALTR